MAKLPPKIPNWPDFSNQKFISPYMSTTTTLPPAAPENNNPTWVDDFLDFSSSRRGNHRRSISDSITFYESSNSQPVLELECGGGRRQRAMHYSNSASDNDNNTEEYLHQFVKFDYDDEGEHLVSSMFNDEEVSLALGASTLPPPPPPAAVPVSNSNPSTPSDLGSIEDVNNNKQANFPNGEFTGNKLPKCEARDEMESSVKSESEAQQTLSPATGVAIPTMSESERIVDPKRVKRILANRQSAQRSRVRKLQYISELERGVANLQAEVSVLSPRVAFLDHQRLILNVDNSALKQRIAALAQDKIFKDAHQEALKNEIERLRQVYERQQGMKSNMDSNVAAATTATNNVNNAAASPPPTTAPLADPKVCMENEDQQQLLLAN